MNLFILRHGLAVEPGTNNIAKDSERPLTPKGERKLWKIAEALEEMELRFDWILCSPYVRARQTAEIVAEALRVRQELETTDHLTPDGSFKRLVELINARRPAAEEVLLVGHEPHLSRLISLLLSGRTEVQVLMKKAGLCKLAVEELEAGQCATLEWLLTPWQMCLMA